MMNLQAVCDTGKQCSDFKYKSCACLVSSLFISSCFRGGKLAFHLMLLKQYTGSYLHVVLGESCTTHYISLSKKKKTFKITGNMEQAFKLDSSIFEGNKTRGIFISKVSGKDHKQKETSSRKQVMRKLLCGASAEQ